MLDSNNTFKVVVEQLHREIICNYGLDVGNGGGAEGRGSVYFGMRLWKIFRSSLDQRFLNKVGSVTDAKDKIHEHISVKKIFTCVLIFLLIKKECCVLKNLRLCWT